MAYLRAKKTKTGCYLYLVRSVWDKKNNTSKQEIIKYLGKASDVLREDIPSVYKNDPKIMATLARYSPENMKLHDDVISNSRDSLFRGLLEGDVQKCEGVCSRYAKTASITDFFEKILKPVMYQIGDDWKAGKIDIAAEHVASNIAQNLVRGTRFAVQKNDKLKVLLCVPAGEEHHLGCDILDVFFSARGFRVFNMGTPLPAASILRFIDDNKPNVIMISITLEDNLVAGQRLVKKISSVCDIPIFVGGGALQSENIPVFQAEIIKDMKLDAVLQKIRRQVATI
ncbi:MAG: cobalamin-dependent protein [Thaumarchaeota archaeon]|nr:cobalamin-dependent protein [Nitrososphaerota archaeon]